MAATDGGSGIGGDDAKPLLQARRECIQRRLPLDGLGVGEPSGGGIEALHRVEQPYCEVLRCDVRRLPFDETKVGALQVGDDG